MLHMTRPSDSGLAPLVVAFIVALAIRSFGAWFSHGDAVVDVASFEHWAKLLDAGQNPYLSTSNPANYPPLWVYVCWTCLVVSRCTGLSFDLVAKLFVSLFDAATVIPVGLMARAHVGSESAGRAASVMYVLNPVAILIAAFHGQNDPVVVGLIAWSIWLITAKPITMGVEFGAIVFGVSLCIKPFGMLFLPLILASTDGWGRRALLFLLVSIPMLISALPYLISTPVALFGAASTYRGPPDFGYVGIYNAWMNLGHGSSGEPIVRSLPGWIRLAYVVVFSLIWWQFRCATLLQQVCAVILSLYLFYGALGAQYLIWIVPFAAAIRDRHLMRASLITAVALVAFYQLNHPAILTGRLGVQLRTGIAIPQWNGILLIAQVALYVTWIRWMRDLMIEYEQRHPDQFGVARLIQRLISREST
jgi:hypothetical protein